MQKLIILALLISSLANAQFSNTERQELGDVNLIENAGGENGLQRWTNSGGGTFATESGANVAVGSRSFSWDASAASDTLTSKQQSIPVGLQNRFCYASFLYKGGDANITAQVIDGSLTVLASKTLTAQTDYSLSELSFTCPSSGTVAFQLSAGSDAAILYLDQVFVGIRAANVTHSVSPTVYELSKQSIGTVGAVDNTQQAVSLTDISAADSNVAGFSLSGGVTKTFGTATATLTNNAVAAFDSEGFYGRGDVARFDGSSNPITSTDSHFLSTGKDFAYSFWIKFTDISQNYNILGNGTGVNGTRGTDLVWSVQRWFFRFSENGGSTVTDEIQIDGDFVESNKWYHIALTYDFSATTATAYINGLKAGENTAVTDTNTESTFYLGDQNAASSFEGEIQDFIWIDNDLLSESEINAIYSRRFSGPQIKAGHVLDSDSFPSSIASSNLSFYNLGDLNDDSGNARTLTNVGSTTFTGLDIFGVSGIAIFDGSSQTLTSTDAFFDLVPTDRWMLGGWYAAEDWSDAGTLISYWDGSPDNGPRIETFSGDLLFSSYEDGSTITSISVPINLIDGTWHHVALAYDGTSLKGYLDGVEVGSSGFAGQADITGATFAIGSRYVSGTPGGFYTGKAQDIFFVKDSMSSDDYRKIYSAKLTHNQSVGIGDQQWYGNFSKSDNSLISNELDQDWLLDKKSNFLFIETGLEPEDSLSLRLQNQSFSATSIPIKTFTTGILEAAPSFPINTGLPCSPQDFYVRTEGQSLAGQWDKRFDLLSVTDSGTLNGDVSSLTIDASHRLEIVAGCVAPALSFNLDNFDLLITNNILQQDLFVNVGKTLFRPNLEVPSGKTLTVDGTFNTVGALTGSGTITGTGTISSIDEQQVFGPDKTFQGNVTIEGELSTSHLSIARLRLLSDFTLNGVLNQTITWDTSDFIINPDNFSFASGVVTVNRPCTVRLDWKLSSDITIGNTTARIYVNRGSGDVSEYALAQDWNSTGGFFSPHMQYIVPNLNAGDSFYVTQNETNASTVDILSSFSYLEIEMIK